MTNPQHVRTPPAGALPEDLRPMLAEFERLRDAWRTASTRASTLASSDAEQAAERADVKAALDAARDGTDPGAVGTPAADQLRADRGAAERAEAAYRRSMEDYWTATFAPALRAAADAQIDLWRTERNTRAQEVHAALQTLRRAENRWLRASEAVAFYQRIAGGDAFDFGGLSVPSRGTREPDSAVAVVSAGLEKALATVAQAQDAGAQPADEQPHDEQLDQPQHPKPRRRPARIK